MRRTTPETAVLLTLVTCVLSSGPIHGDEMAFAPCEENALPQFKHHAVAREDVDVPQLDLDSHPVGRRFATRLTAAVATEPADLAGHYLVVDWSCGTACMMFAIVDLWSGEIWHDETLILTRGIASRSDSRLVVLNPGPRSRAEETATRYYLWQASALEPLCEAGDSPGDDAAERIRAR